ncbi:hypothetical protein D1AOALGA4SA_4596 [Olavius algarvensis Delta 1 endosymbiont]|nr:hypothetical protein D1AOALGA4SA_4596 [Olavius algarvensis Delta 1 endosymbiont]
MYEFLAPVVFYLGATAFIRSTISSEKNDECRLTNVELRNSIHI